MEELSEIGVEKSCFPPTVNNAPVHGLETVVQIFNFSHAIVIREKGTRILGATHEPVWGSQKQSGRDYCRRCCTIVVCESSLWRLQKWTEYTPLWNPGTDVILDFNPHCEDLS